MATLPQPGRPRDGERTRPRADASPPTRPAPGPDELRAATKLLGEDSPTVRRELRRAFRARPRLARHLLRRRAADPDPRVRAHVRALRLELDREEVVRRLLRHLARPRIDLERALMLLGRFEDPELDARPYRRALDAFAREIARRSTSETDELERGRVLASYLGGEVGFRGVPDPNFPTGDVFLHRAIETRRGLPLTLCALYLVVARRVGLRVGVVPLPGHVMLRLYGRGRNLIVDPFHGGEARSQATLMHFLAQHGLAFRSAWFRDADDRALFLRQVRNLGNGLSIHERTSELRCLRPLLALAQNPRR